MHPARRVLLVLLLGLCLGAASAAAAENRSAAFLSGERAFSGPMALLERLQGLLTSVWGSEGCRIDPLGRCSPEQALSRPVPSDEAPNEAVESDTGCAIDPWGACVRNR